MSGCAYVIGGAGFIGTKLVDSFVARGGRVVVVDPHATTGSANVRVISADVSSQVLDEAFGHDAPGIVFHLGGSGSVGMAEADPRGDHARTVDSTRMLLERLSAHPRCRVILVSSAAVYGDVEAASLDEAAPRRPISAYGRNKAAAEDLVFAARAAGRVASVVRYFSVYGPGLRKQLLWDACTRLARGDADFGGTGQEVRDWLHVADAIALLHRVADADHAPEVVNGGSGVGTSVGDVLGGLARALGRPAIVRFSGVAREGDPRRMVANVGVAHALGWRSSRALSEGLVEYARWFESAS